MAAPRVTRAQLLAQPRSGATSGAARGGPVTPPDRQSPSPAAEAPGGRPARRRSAAPPGSPASATSPSPASPAGPGSSKIAETGPSRGERARAAAGGKVIRTANRARTVSAEGAGGLLALFAYPIGLNLIRGGPAQAWGWVRAKWFNEPYAPPARGKPAGTHQKPGTTTAGGRG